MKILYYSPHPMLNLAYQAGYATHSLSIHENSVKNTKIIIINLVEFTKLAT